MLNRDTCPSVSDETARRVRKGRGHSWKSQIRKFDNDVRTGVITYDAHGDVHPSRGIASVNQFYREHLCPADYSDGAPYVSYYASPWELYG